MIIDQKLNTNRIQTYGDEVTDKQTFSLKAGAGIMHILSSGIYSDKPWAIVRELVANAWDAYVANGKVGENSCSVDIANGYLSIRDYGTGLSHQALMTLMSTYGMSTKSMSNEAIGGFGIGSKVPFCYTEEFTIISYFNGEMRTYHAIMSQSGVPEISLLGQAPTEEPNGLLFKVPIKQRDQNEFQRAVHRIALYTLQPMIVLGEEVKPETHTYVKLAEGIYFTERKRNEHHTVLIGGIEYSVEDPITRDHNHIIAFDIGMIDVAVSREKVSYTQKTKANIDLAKNLYTDYIIAEAKRKLAEMEPYGKIAYQRAVNSLQLWVRCKLQVESNGTVSFTLFEDKDTKIVNHVYLEGQTYLLDKRRLGSESLRYLMPNKTVSIREERYLTYHKTREEWMQSPLGPEILANPGMFVFSSEAPRAPKKERVKKEKLPDSIFEGCNLYTGSRKTYDLNNLKLGEVFFVEVPALRQYNQSSSVLPRYFDSQCLSKVNIGYTAIVGVTKKTYEKIPKDYTIEYVMQDRFLKLMRKPKVIVDKITYSIPSYFQGLMGDKCFDYLSKVFNSYRSVKREQDEITRDFNTFRGLTKEHKLPTIPDLNKRQSMALRKAALSQMTFDYQHAKSLISE